jgi:hypothetical protein
VNHLVEWTYPLTLTFSNHQKVHLKVGPNTAPALIYRLLRAGCRSTAPHLLYTRSGVEVSDTFVLGIQDFGVVHGDLLSASCARDIDKNGHMIVTRTMGLLPGVVATPSCSADARPLLERTPLDQWMDATWKTLFVHDPKLLATSQTTIGDALRLRWRVESGFSDQSPWQADPAQPDDLASAGDPPLPDVYLKRAHDSSGSGHRAGVSSPQRVLARRRAALFTRFYNTTTHEASE